MMKQDYASRQKGKTNLSVRNLLLGFSLVVLLAILILNIEQNNSEVVHPRGTPQNTATESAPAANTVSDATQAAAHEATDSAKATALAPQPITAETTALETPKAINKTSFKKAQLPIEHWVSPQGAQVYFLPITDIPMVDVRFHFYAGSSYDGDTAGLSKLTNAMIGEGTKEKNVDAITAGFEKLGAKFVVNSIRDVAVVQLRSLTETQYLNPALELFAEVIGEPSFPQENFERNLGLMKTALKEQEQLPHVVISNHFFSTLFKNHPYQHPPQGTLSSLETITVDKMKAFYEKHYVTQNAVIAIVGNVSRQQAEAIVESSTQKLKAGQKPQKLPPTPIPNESHYQHVTFPSQQTHLFIGTTSIPYGHPDFIPLLVGNEILGGGGFSSILNQVIRQDRGLSYSVSSTVAPMLAGGSFYINLQTQNANAKEALALARENLQNFITKGPTEEQLQKAKENIIGSHSLKTATNNAIASNLGSIGFYGLPLTHIDDFTEAVFQTTTASIQKAFQNNIDANRLIIMTLGPQPIE
jgi:zinc protease